eukprot:344455-Rhodomonas_salina.1
MLRMLSREFVSGMMHHSPFAHALTAQGRTAQSCSCQHEEKFLQSTLGTWSRGPEVPSKVPGNSVLRP